MEPLTIKFDTTEAMAAVRDLRKELEATPIPGVMLLINPATCTMEDLVKVARAAGVQGLTPYREKTSSEHCDYCKAFGLEPDGACDACPLKENLTS